MTPRAIFGLVFAAATILAAQAQRGTWLGWKWDEGALRRYRFTQELDQEISGLQEKQLSWTISYLVKQEVRSVDADTGVATVAHTYESGVIVATEKSQEGQEHVEYDSAKPDAAEKARHRLIAPYAAFVGETLVFDVDREGQVVRLEGAQKILSKAMTGLGQSNPLLAPLLETYKQSLSDDGMRAELERQLRVVPGRHVKPRDSWQVTAAQSMPLVGNLENQTLYTLDRLRRAGDSSFAEITAEGTLNQAAPGGGAAAKPDPLADMLEAKLISSSVKGRTRFAIEAGAVTSSSYDIETVWEISIKGGKELEEALQGLGGAKMVNRMRQRGGMELVE